MQGVGFRPFVWRLAQELTLTGWVRNDAYGVEIAAQGGAAQIAVLLRRQKAPSGYFPSDSYVDTRCVDAVERRLYSVIGQGDDSASRVSERLREDDPRIAFGAALAALALIAGLIVLAGGPLP